MDSQDVQPGCSEDMREKEPEKEDEEDSSEISDDDIQLVPIEHEEDAGLVKLVDGREEWLVEKIVGKKIVNGVTYYLVKWAEWTKRFNSWEPINHLSNCMRAVKKFEKRTKGQAYGSIAAVKLETETEDQVDFEGARFDLSKVKLEPADEAVVDEQQATMTNDPPNDEIIIIENTDSDDDEDVEKLMDFWGPSFPLFRSKWRPSEEPLCVTGSSVRETVLYHMVRLKTPNDPVDVMQNPLVGITSENMVIIESEMFRLAHPQVLIQYYEKIFVLTDNLKSEEELTECAARAGLVYNFRKAKVDVGYARITNDMLPPDQRAPEQTIADMTAAEKEASKYSSEEKEDEVSKKDRKDRYGLPYYYGEEQDSSESDSDSSDSDAWEPVQVCSKEPSTA